MEDASQRDQEGLDPIHRITPEVILHGMHLHLDSGQLAQVAAGLLPDLTHEDLHDIARRAHAIIGADLPPAGWQPERRPRPYLGDGS